MTKDEAYSFLYSIAEGTAAMFGKTCEALIHDMSGQHIVTVAIFNGHVSGRKVGSTFSIFGNDTAVSDNSNVDLEKNYANKLVVLPSGKQIKSATFHLRGEDYHYALGFNYDVTVMEQMRRVLESATAVEGDLFTSMSKPAEPQIDLIFQACLDVINKPVDQMKKADRITLVRMLKDKNAFSFQRSVPYIAERMNVSKYSIYKYINEIGD